MIMSCGLCVCRLRLQRTQAVLGRSAGRLSAGHEARQEDVRRRPVDARRRSELTRSNRRQDVRRPDRNSRYLTSSRRIHHVVVDNKSN